MLSFLLSLGNKSESELAEIPQEVYMHSSGEGMHNLDSEGDKCRNEKIYYLIS